MYTIPYAAEQIAHEYTRDRIRDAEARQNARTARMAARERRYVESPAGPVAPTRRWRLFPARATMA